jgi:hypothetical protein
VCPDIWEDALCAILKRPDGWPHQIAVLHAGRANLDLLAAAAELLGVAVMLTLQRLATQNSFLQDQVYTSGDDGVNNSFDEPHELFFYSAAIRAQLSANINPTNWNGIAGKGEG